MKGLIVQALKHCFPETTEHLTSHNFWFKTEAQNCFLRCSLSCTVEGSCTHTLHQIKEYSTQPRLADSKWDLTHSDSKFRFPTMNSTFNYTKSAAFYWLCCTQLSTQKNSWELPYTHTVTAVFIGKMLKHLHFIVRDKLCHTVQRNSILTDSQNRPDFSVDRNCSQFPFHHQI